MFLRKVARGAIRTGGHSLQCVGESMSCCKLPWRFGAVNAFRALLQHVDVAGKRTVEHIRVAILLRSMSRVSVLRVLRVT